MDWMTNVGAMLLEIQQSGSLKKDCKAQLSFGPRMAKSSPTMIRIMTHGDPSIFFSLALEK
jgi:hypothetical protein